MSEVIPKVRKCGHCKAEGHDKRNCPVLKAERALNVAPEAPVVQHGGAPTPPEPPIDPVPVQIPTRVDWGKAFYVVFDLETTGGSRVNDDIMEISAMVLDPDGIAIEDGHFSSFIHTDKKIPPFITNLTNINKKTLAGALKFPQVIVELFRFIDHVVAKSNENSPATTPIADHIIMVAHNAKSFDIPFLLNSLKRHNLLHLWENDKRYGVYIDTYSIARKLFINQATAKKNIRKPANCKLGVLYQFFTGNEIQDAHRAYADVKALYTVFRNEQMWFERTTYVVYNVLVETDRASPSLADDSDASESGSDDDDDDVIDSNEYNEAELAAVGDFWETKKGYKPDEGEIPGENFVGFYTSPTRTSKYRPGVQIPHASCNSPRKAWKQIFTVTILDRIVKHTNKYGERKSKEWTDITRTDLQDFIAVLFLMSVQKRKDKPSNWFSDNPMLESILAKKIMSGRQFNKMLMYLHCCEVDDDGINEQGEYDPSYKIAELKRELEKRWNALFIPEQELSLDETLLRAFGRMKFKVRIISKAARYGIKLYVITDARTSYVLGMIVYTGKYTYHESASESDKKTVQVVQQLCEPFRGTHRTIYVDRFYTSVELLKELEDMKLYMTGTVMSNRLPKHMVYTKKSKEYKAMKRGQCIKFRLHYKTRSGERKRCGLVGWKDGNMVYCLTNDTSTSPMDECKRRSFQHGGIITVPRPVVIARYNKYMGGVDLADNRRLHNDCTIRGQNRWWLKLFFYLLDAGTSNALVLYNLTRHREKDMNISEFKLALIDWLVGDRLTARCASAEGTRPSVEHTLVNIGDGERRKCTYCSLTGNSNSRTRFECRTCGVPFCTPGSGKTSNDCFAIAHANDDIRRLCVERHEKQKAHTPKAIRRKKKAQQPKA